VRFDLIYVDGPHKSDQVLMDAKNSFRHLEKFGYLVFDDFLWNYYGDSTLNPNYAINKFIWEYKEKLKIILSTNTVILK